MNEATRERVRVLLRSFMDSWIQKQYDELRTIEEQGISPRGILAPFHDALVPGIRALGETRLLDGARQPSRARRA